MSISPPSEASEPVYRIAVRELCEFAAKRGDLDLRFTPAPTAQEGIAGHATVGARRGSGYRRELPLSGNYGPLRVSGRADGWYAERGELEEIKTHRGDLALMPDNHRALHWAQLKVYGWLLCAGEGLAELRLRLVYFDVDRQRETDFDERHSAESLREFFDLLCQAFLGWGQAQLRHQVERDAALRLSAFPYPQFPAGQRQLAEAVYRRLSRGGSLLAQAPTGTGKSMATLFPALKALAQGRVERVFCLAAKSSGRQLALDAARRLLDQQPALPLRVLELVAREKSCEHPDKACHGESCPLARGFYDRLPQARAEAVRQTLLDQSRLRALALAHGVCPYYLSQDLARWCDVVVGDYNYYFDHSALLHALSQINGWKLAVLVDEAHNLVERGRRMYSAELRQQDLLALKSAQAPAPVRKALGPLVRAWNRLHRDQVEAYRVLPDLPGAFLAALQKALKQLGEHFTEQPRALDPALQAWAFEAGSFLRLAESFGPHSLCELHLQQAASPRGGGRSTVRLRNLVPAPFLAPRFAAAHACVLYSATLAPARYQRDLLGLPEDSDWLDLPSPFRAEQLRVRIADRIPTRYRERAASVQPLAALIAGQYRERPGNYLAYFSSYEYLEAVRDALSRQAPEIPLWAQQRQMREAEQQGFLDRYREQGQGVGLAVLGGVFGEGIDLPGSRLIGAFVITLGLPQINPGNEQLRERLQQLLGAGYEYAYLYPGLQKVVQAAGRVIRSSSDQGLLWLVDARYRRADVQALLPTWWQIEGPDRATAGS